MQAKTVYENARVLTLDPKRPRAAGLVVGEGRIVALLDAGETAPGGRRVDLGGATVLPGLVDAHLHLEGVGQSEREIDLSGAASAAELAERVGTAASSLSPGELVRGRGWDQHLWSDPVLPSKALIPLGDRPAWLVRVDGHAVWVNEATLALSGIDARTPDPPGGEILRDARGEPTGLLVDNAIALASEKLPAPSFEETLDDVERGARALVRLGLTGVHAMSVGASMLEALRSLEAAGRLPLRVSCWLDARDPALVDAALEGPPDPPGAGLVRRAGLKLFADGALGSRGAALEAPYLDRPGSRGLLLTSPEALSSLVGRAHAAGWPVAIHAIGDRGARHALDAVASAGRLGLPDRIEHAELFGDDAPARMAELGVAASLQPLHLTADAHWAEAALGPERAARLSPTRTLLRAGVVLALGSDAPVASPDPWRGIHAAVTRTDASGRPGGGHAPGERLAVLEAIEGFSLGPARAAGAAALGGALFEGALCDLTVVDRDPEDTPAGALCDVRTLRTIVGGREVFGPEASPR